MKRALPVALVACVAAGCVSHIAPYRRKERKFDVGDYAQDDGSSSGSIYRSSVGGIFEDDRARGVGDIVVIKVDEFDSAQRDSSTKLDRKSGLSAGIANNLGLLPALPTGVTADALLGASSANSFDGSGKVARAGHLVAMLPVRVRKVLPNGDLYVEGDKVILVNDEEHHLYISGLVRPLDIGSDDVVLSSRIADAEIEYTGRGNMTDSQRQGWLARMFNKVWPF